MEHSRNDERMMRYRSKEYYATVVVNTHSGILEIGGTRFRGYRRWLYFVVGNGTHVVVVAAG